MRSLGRDIAIRSAVLLIGTLLGSSEVTAGTRSAMEPRAPSMNLVEIAQEAAVIVRGVVVESVAEPHPELTNLSTLRVTLQVLERLAGHVPDLHTFRQMEMGDEAGYRVGEEVVLFLRAPSRYGLTSPVGFAQGRFRVHGTSSRRVVLNGVGGRGLLHRVHEDINAGERELSDATRAALEPDAPAGGGSELLRLDSLREIVQAARYSPPARRARGERP